MKPSIFSAGAILLAAMLSSNATALSVRSGETLEISFRLPASSSPALLIHPTDTLYLAFDTASTGTATSAEATLFDGAVRLGANTSQTGAVAGFPFYFYWTALGSNFTSPQATAIDGSTLVDRTIAGHVSVLFNGDFEFPGLYLDAGNGQASAIWIEGGTQAQIDSISVSSVPEPATASLLLFGIAGVTAVTWRAGRKRD